MTTEQLRELDEWIIDMFGGRQNYVRNFGHTPPTMNDAVALAVLEKCGREIVSIQKLKGWTVDNLRSGGTIEVSADALPLAICQFARQLFSK